MNAHTVVPTLPRRTPRLVVMIAMAVLLSAASLQSAWAQAIVPTLNTVTSFAVLAGTPNVTNTGPTVITGDVGIHPALAVTGLAVFPLTGPGTVHGVIVQGGGVALGAKSDLVIAYDFIDGQLCDVTYPGAFDLVGLTLAPGVYCSPSSLFVSGTLTLDAQFDPNAVWIFQSETSTLITASASTVRVINEGRDCNVYWKVGSSATLGTDSTFVGNILALTSISLTTGADVSGRVLARNGAVTMQSNTVNNTACTAPPVPPTPTAPGLSLSKTPDRTTYTSVGDTIDYTYVLKNTGSTTLNGPFTVVDDVLGPFFCGAGDTILQPGETVTCFAQHVIGPGDVGESSWLQGVTANINTGPWLQFTKSTQDTKITGAGPGVPNGTYPCWCIQDRFPNDLHNQPAQLYSTVGGSLPADVASLAWGKVNYTLNHKIKGNYGTGSGANLKFLKDVQTAIWVLLGEPNPEFGISATAKQMIDAANANANFVPVSGNIAAVIVYSDGMTGSPRRTFQESICEMNSKLKSIVNHATASGDGAQSNEVVATVRQVRVIQ